jgi:hypothetical protein
MLPAVTLVVPLTVRALEEVESTVTVPGTLMLELPDRVRAPLAVPLRTKTDGTMLTLTVVLLARKLLVPR